MQARVLILLISCTMEIKYTRKVVIFMNNYQKTGLLLFLALFVCAGTLFAQTNPFTAPPSAMDEVSEGSATGGAAPATYQDRFREVGMAAGPAPQGPGNRGAPPGAMDPAMGPMGPMGVAPRGQATPVPATPTPKQIRVLAGSRVVCAVSGRLLEDTVYKYVPEEEKSNYYDDGTHGDEEAGDGTYTNIEVINDVMSPESHSILQKILTLLGDIEDTEPMDFYRLNVVTTNPLSSLAKETEQEQDRDVKLGEWNDRFLQVFRINENDPTSPFYPLYVPPPPSYPNAPLPDNFKPVVKATPTPEAGGAGRMGPGMGGPMGGGGRGRSMDVGRF